MSSTRARAAVTVLWATCSACYSAPVSVSASAVSVLFNVAPPSLDAVMPDNIWMVLIVLAVGIIISILLVIAILLWADANDVHVPIGKKKN